MKPNEGSTIVGMPKEASVVGDDRYLVEMTDRIQRLRSLLGEQERQSAPKRRWINRKGFGSTM